MSGAELILRDPLGERPLAASDFPISIGGPGHTIVFGDLHAADAAAWIAWHDGQLFLQPAADGPPVLCNGSAVKRSTWLREGDVIDIARGRLRLGTTGGTPTLDDRGRQRRQPDPAARRALGGPGQRWQRRGRRRADRRRFSTPGRGRRQHAGAWRHLRAGSSCSPCSRWRSGSCSRDDRCTSLRRRQQTRYACGAAHPSCTSARIISHCPASTSWWPRGRGTTRCAHPCRSPTRPARAFASRCGNCRDACSWRATCRPGSRVAGRELGPVPGEYKLEPGRHEVHGHGGAVLALHDARGDRRRRPAPDAAGETGAVLGAGRDPDRACGGGRAGRWQSPGQHTCPG